MSPLDLYPRLPVYAAPCLRGSVQTTTLVTLVGSHFQLGCEIEPMTLRRVPYLFAHPASKGDCNTKASLTFKMAWKQNNNTLFIL